MTLCLVTGERAKCIRISGRPPADLSGLQPARASHSRASLLGPPAAAATRQHGQGRRRVPPRGRTALCEGLYGSGHRRRAATSEAGTFPWQIFIMNQI